MRSHLEANGDGLFLMLADEFERFDAALDGPFDLIGGLLEFLVRNDDGVLCQRHLVAAP